MTEMRTCLRCLGSLTLALVVCSLLFVESGSHAIGGSNSGAFASAYAGTGAFASDVGALKGAGESSRAYDRHKGIRRYSSSDSIFQDKDIDRDSKSYGVVPNPGASHDGIKGSNGYNKHSCSKCKWENDDYWEQDEPEEEGDENDGHECDDGQYRPYYGLRHHERKPGLRAPGVHKIGPIGDYADDELKDLVPTTGYTTLTNFAAKTTPKPKSILNPFAYTTLKQGYVGVTAGGLAGATVYVHPQHGVSSNSLPDGNEGTTPGDFESSTRPAWASSREPARSFITPKPGTSWNSGVHPSSRKPWNVGYNIDTPAASTVRPEQGWTLPGWSSHNGFTPGSFAVTTKPGSNWNTGLDSTSRLPSSQKPWNGNHYGTKAVGTSDCSSFDPTCIQDKQNPIKLSATPGYIDKTKGDESPGGIVPQIGSAISPPHISYGRPNENHNYLYGHHATQSSSAHAGSSATSSASHHVTTHNFGTKDNPFFNKPASTQTPYSAIDSTYPNTYDPRGFSVYNTPERKNTWPSTVANTFETTVRPYGGISSAGHHHVTQSSNAHAGSSATSSVSHHHVGVHNYEKKDNPFLNKPVNTQTPYSGIYQVHSTTYDPRGFSDYNTPGREQPSSVASTFGTTVGPYGGITSSSHHHGIQNSNAHAGSSATSSASHHVGVHNFGKIDNPFLNKPLNTQKPSFSDYNTPEREKPSIIANTFGTTVGPYGGISASDHHATQSSNAHAGSSATSSASHHVATHNFGKKDNPFLNKPTSIQTPYSGIYQVHPNTYDPRLYDGTSSSSTVPSIQDNILSSGKLPGSPIGSGVYDHPGVTKPSYGSGITSTSSWLNTGHPASGNNTWHSLGTHTSAYAGAHAGAHAGVYADTHAGFPSTVGFGTTKSPFGHTNIPNLSLGDPYSETELKQHSFHSTSNSASASSSAHGHHHNTYNTHIVGTTPIYQETSSYPGVKGVSKRPTYGAGPTYGTKPTYGTGPTYGIVPHDTHSDPGTDAWSNKPSESGSKTWPDKQPGSETLGEHPGTINGASPGRHLGNVFGVWSTMHPGSGSGTWPSKKPEDGSATRPDIFGNTVDPHGGSSKVNCTGDTPGESCNKRVSGPSSGVHKTYYPAGISNGHVPHIGSVHGSDPHVYTTGAYPGTNIGCPSGDSSCNQGVTPEGSAHWNPLNPFLFKVGGGTPSHVSRPWNSGTTAKPVEKGNPFLDSSWNRPKPDYNNNNNANNDQNAIPQGEGSTKPISQGNPFLNDSKRKGSGNSGSDPSYPSGQSDPGYPGLGTPGSGGYGNVKGGSPAEGLIPFGGRKPQVHNPFLGSGNSGSDPSYLGGQSDPGYPGLGTPGSGGYGSVKGGSHAGASSQTSGGSYASARHPGGVFGGGGSSGSVGTVPRGFDDYPGTGIGQFNIVHPALTGSHLPESPSGAHVHASSFAHTEPLHFPDIPESGNAFDPNGWSSGEEHQHHSNSWASSSAFSSSSSGSNHHYWGADHHPTERSSYIKG